MAIFGPGNPNISRELIRKVITSPGITSDKILSEMQRTGVSLSQLRDAAGDIVDLSDENVMPFLASRGISPPAQSTAPPTGLIGSEQALRGGLQGSIGALRQAVDQSGNVLGGARRDVNSQIQVGRGGIANAINNNNANLGSGISGNNQDIDRGLNISQADLNAAIARNNSDIRDAINRNTSDIRDAISTGGRDTSRAVSAATRATGSGVSALQPFVRTGSNAFNQVAALLGASGSDAQQRALENFANSPGQQFLRDQGEQAVLRNAAALGGVGGGNVLKELQQFGTGVAAQDFNNQLLRLNQIGQTGFQGAGSQANLFGNLAGINANLLSQRAGINANLLSQLAGSNANLLGQGASTNASLAGQALGIRGGLSGQRAGTNANLLGQFSGLNTGLAANNASLAGQGANILAGIGSQDANQVFNAGLQASNQALNTGGALASGRTRAGEALADLTNQQGVGLSGLINQSGGNLAGILQQAGRDQGLSQQQLAQLLAGVLQNSSGQVAGLRNIPGIQETQGQITNIGRALSGIGTAAGAIGISDIRLKENIKYITTARGNNIYTWNWSKKGRDLAGNDSGVGVIAQEIIKYNPDAIIRNPNGYLMVNYGKVFND